MSRSGKRLPATAWKGVLRRTLQQFNADDLTDSAAALTYYAVLSIFPGLLVLVSVLRLFGQDTVDSVVHNLSDLAPGKVADLLRSSAGQLQASGSGSAVAVVVVSVLTALWSASGYVGAFMRAANTIYDVPEGRPTWKKIPTRLALTVFAGTMLVVATVIVVFTGRLARDVGKALGMTTAAVDIWSIAKWPLLVILVAILFAVLYWASPNASFGRFRWISRGGLLAVVIWLIASAAFAFYLTNFNSYNKVYGSLATVIAFLVWLWISNIAFLLGAEFDAELQRGRAIEAGMPADHEPYMPLRDTRKLPSGSIPAEDPAGEPVAERPGA